MKFGIVLLPGSNCDHDAEHVAREVVGAEAELLWHGEADLKGSDCIIIPGGFSYGDYLRAGALSKFAPVMNAVREHASSGGLVMGICNGFQILTELGLLPGALIRNQHLRFVSRTVTVRCETSDTPFTGEIEEGKLLRLPVAHGEGNYYADEETVRQLEEQDRVVFRYCDETGEATPESNPNGSIANIAGIVNEERNVLGLMPHPERCSEEILGSSDGRAIFESIVASIESSRTIAAAK